MASYGRIPKILNKVKEASRPDRFTQDFLTTKLGFAGGSAMAFEIYLPQERVVAQRKLWPNRLPIDDLDAAVRVAPERMRTILRQPVRAAR